VLSLDEESVPEVERKTGVRSAEDGNKMGFERLYGLFCPIAPVIVGGDQLVTHLVSFYDGLEVRGAFIVKDVFFGENARAVQAREECLIGSNHFARGTILHRFDEDC
jgi:hypothetical protein